MGSIPDGHGSSCSRRSASASSMSRWPVQPPPWSPEFAHEERRYPQLRQALLTGSCAGLSKQVGIDVWRSELSPRPSAISASPVPAPSAASRIDDSSPESQLSAVSIARSQAEAAATCPPATPLQERYPPFTLDRSPSPSKTSPAADGGALLSNGNCMNVLSTASSVASTRLQSDDSRLLQLSSTVQAVAAEVEAQARRLESMETRFWHWRHQLDEEVRKRCDALGKWVEFKLTTGSQDDSVGKKQEARLQEVERQFQSRVRSLEKNFAAVLDREIGSSRDSTTLLAAYGRRFAQMEERLDQSLGQDTHEMQTRLQAQEQRIQSLRAIVETHEAGLRTVRDGLSASKAELGGQLQRVRQGSDQQDLLVANTAAEQKKLCSRLDHLEEQQQRGFQEERRPASPRIQERSGKGVDVPSAAGNGDVSSTADGRLALEELLQGISGLSGRIDGLEGRCGQMNLRLTTRLDGVEREFLGSRLGDEVMAAKIHAAAA
eukprot:TRINITY_DN81428_c0_g1_i1.p1 TRINITY_DN81428_c0_g1~~TRINITY_DN81428_c0_g1_i1.p1  ORF type:complete len:491 (-),score=104.21 TRINITY_DN81428_c0_g1_i1:496-1968(-)